MCFLLVLPVLVTLHVTRAWASISRKEPVHISSTGYILRLCLLLEVIEVHVCFKKVLSLFGGGLVWSGIVRRRDMSAVFVVPSMRHFEWR